jgi:hypothetical protein
VLVGVAEHAGEAAGYCAPWLVVVNDLHHALCHAGEEIASLEKGEERGNEAPP